MNDQAADSRSLARWGVIIVVAVSASLGGRACVAANAQCKAPFFPQERFAATEYFSDWAVADMNGDGWDDLLIQEWYEGDLLLLMSKGDGRFADAVRFGTSNGGCSCTARLGVEDLDADGDPDVVVTVRSTGNLEVLFNDGSGVLAEPIAIPTGVTPGDVCLGDVDGDGDVDAVVCDSGLIGEGALAVLKNDGMGGLDGPVWSIATSVCCVLELVDMTGDGVLDVVVASWEEDVVAVLEGDGTGAFGHERRIPVAPAPMHLAVADLDGDGDPDVAAAGRAECAWNGLNGLSILWNNGSGELGGEERYLLGGCPFSLDAGDVDEDGDVDLVVGDYPSVRVMRNDGLGWFLDTRFVEEGAGQFATAIIDADLDGDPDLAFLNLAAGDVGITWNEGEGPADSHHVMRTGWGPRQIEVVDLNGDGEMDVVTPNDWSNDLSIHMGQGGGSFAYELRYGLTGSPEGMVAGDLDGDGDVDLAFVLTERLSWDDPLALVSVVLNGGGGSLALEQTYEVGEEPSSIAGGDFDNDGDIDLAITEGESMSVRLLWNNGSGTFLEQEILVRGEKPREIVAADLEPDGDLDLIVHQPWAGTIVLLKNDGSGGFTEGIGMGSPLVGYLGLVADLDADGHVDILVTSGYLAEAHWNDGDAGFTGSVSLGEDVWFGKGSSGDVNADGLPDLVVDHDSGVRVYLNLGGRAFDRAYRHGTAGGDSDVITIIDINGDNSVDVLAGSSHGDQISILVNQCNGSGECDGDLSGDGLVVDFQDLLALFSVWGPCPAPCPGDLAVPADNIVDFQDLLALFGLWGACP